MSEAADDDPPTFIERRLAFRRWVRRALFGLTAVLVASVLVGRTGLLGRAGDDWTAFDRKAYDTPIDCSVIIPRDLTNSGGTSSGPVQPKAGSTRR